MFFYSDEEINKLNKKHTTYLVMIIVILVLAILTPILFALFVKENVKILFIVLSSLIMFILLSIDVYLFFILLKENKNLLNYYFCVRDKNKDKINAEFVRFENPIHLYNGLNFHQVVVKLNNEEKIFFIKDIEFLNNVKTGQNINLICVDNFICGIEE